ncbi:MULTISPECIES: heme ABC transporter ATP-binding protein [Mesorhizobium]|uniref:Heme ABC transporter ATP-binding protein n=1 Tax=Mesorhizobium denitrificans TaxID=2294114 RepID=A0A371XJV8_9HYPH|nr:MULTISPECIES: heme ABC transporter ATP-binding protein [Mesorhizobium]RFC69505.1 heme ABC transporter ATP-binding protein [Mesorhizobium denitrificans]
MIKFENVSVAIGSKTIIKGIGFEARPSEITVIVGPNGSGKTTLMKAMSGESAYDGSVSINGHEVSAARSRDQALMRAVLPQATTLSFPFTVREIVNLGILSGRSGVSRINDLVERALAAVDLHGFAGRFYQELSGGEQQRVQLARVLCQVWEPVLDGIPRYLFLDEPVSSLDIKHQLAIMETARDYVRRGGGVIAILHDLNLAAMYADRIIVLARGRMVAVGTPDQVIRDDVIAAAFECHLSVGKTPQGNAPFILPQSFSP